MALEPADGVCQRDDLRNAEMTSFFKLPRATQYAAFAVLGLVLFMIFDQYYWWQLRDEYAFGYIVPLFVAYVLYERWPQIARTLMGRPDEAETETESDRLNWLRLPLQVLAVCMVSGGLVSFLLGGMYRSMEGANLITSYFLSFGFANILLGAAYLYGSRRSDGTPIPMGERIAFALMFLFPALIWMLSVPLFDAVHKGISTFLMNKVAAVVFHSFDLLGYAIVQEGSVLKLPNGDVGVEDACSGIRSLTACLFAGSFLGAVSFTQLWKKVFMVGTAMLFAFINNIFRSLFLTVWAYAYGPEALNDHAIIFGIDMGNIHDFTGWVVLGLTVLCLLFCVKLFSIRFEFEETPPPNASQVA